jgi:hypothetical protein
VSKKVTGTEAISYLVSHTFNEELASIEETDGYIDVDDAGRNKFRQYETDYRTLLWTVLNYHPDKRSLKGTGYTVEEAIDGLFEAGIEEREVRGRTMPVVAWFAIHTGIYDSESLGLHYEFTWEV